MKWTCGKRLPGMDPGNPFAYWRRQAWSPNHKPKGNKNRARTPRNKLKEVEKERKRRPLT